MWPFNKRAQQREKAPAEPRRTLSLRGVNRPRADRTIEGNEAIYAAVSRIANTVASMPMHLYRQQEIQHTHPLERLVSLEPNPSFTAFTFRQTLEVLRNTEGNAYVLKVLDNLGAVTRLDILNPTRVQALRDTSGEIWYQISFDDGRQEVCPGWLILNFKHLSANGEKGIRPVDVLRRSLDYDAQVKEMALDQLDGVNNGIMLTVPNSSLNQQQKDELVDRFLQTYEESGRSVVVLEGGLTATHFSSQPVDSSMLDVERITRNRVATVYNLPPSMLGDYSGGSKATEDAMLEFLEMTIVPIAEQYEEECNRKLLTPQDYAAGYRFRMDTSALLRADVKTMAEMYQMAIRGGWLKPNEVRENEYRPADPCGNELMSSRDLIPLRIAVETPELLLGGMAGTGGNSDGKEEKT